MAGPIGETGAMICRSCGVYNPAPARILEIRRASKELAGSCMLCTRNHRMVNVVTSPTNTEIRLCDKCVKEIRSARA